MKNTYIHLNTVTQKPWIGGVFADRYSLCGVTSQIWQDVVSV